MDNIVNKKWNIIYEDEHILLVHKFSGIATESSKVGEKDLVSELRRYLKRNGNTYLGVVHRLDQPVEGIVLFAKNKGAAAFLSKQVSFDGDNKKMRKYYKALCYGKMNPEKGTLTDYLIKDDKTNISKVLVDNSKTEDMAKAKKAILKYEMLDTSDLPNELSMIKVELLTGRHHQIRVQLSNADCPIVGDLKYGNEESIKYSNENGYKNVVLKAYKLSFVHPFTKKEMHFEIE